MKATDLRIGNYYFRKHGKGWAETCIDEDMVGRIFSQSTEYALNDFEPIPLTEEWLVNLGFKETWSDGKERKEYSIGPFYLFHYRKGNNESVKWESGGGDVRVLKYVHSLMNLYHALTGQELELTQ